MIFVGHEYIWIFPSVSFWWIPNSLGGLNWEGTYIAAPTVNVVFNGGLLLKVFMKTYDNTYHQLINEPIFISSLSSRWSWDLLLSWSTMKCTTQNCVVNSIWSIICNQINKDLFTILFDGSCFDTEWTVLYVCLKDIWSWLYHMLFQFSHEVITSLISLPLSTIFCLLDSGRASQLWYTFQDWPGIAFMLTTTVIFDSMLACIRYPHTHRTFIWNVNLLIIVKHHQYLPVLLLLPNFGDFITTM